MSAKKTTGVFKITTIRDGYSSAVVQLYRRYAPTQVAPTPALPTGELIYTFATGVLSGATTSFNGWSQQIPAASADTKLFVTQATATSQDATDEISVNDWSTPVEYVKDGTKGDNGEAAVNVIVTPASLIVNQSLDNPSNLDSLSEQILFQVEKGSAPLNVTKIDSIVVEKDGNRNKISVTGNNSNYATLTAILKDADTNGKYYDQAYFTCRVAYTDGGTTKYVTDVKVKVYANLLGSWSEEVKGDTKNEVARSLSYAYIQDGQGVQTLEQIGTYTKSSTENISTLTKKVDNGKNLLRNALSGSGSFGCSTAKNFTNNPSLRDTTVDYDGYITAAENYTYIFQSGITIERGKWYTVSFEAKSNQTNVGFCVFNYSGDGSVFSGDNCDTNFTPTTSGKKKSITFKVSGTGTVTVAISIKCAALRYPQLELGEAATAFDSGGTDISSRIKQEADLIEALVNDTGVDITNGKINLYADKVKFYKNKASATAGDPAKIWIDGSKGTLHAVDGEFEGTVKATSGRVNSLYIGEGVSDSEARIYMKADETTSGSQTKTPLIYGKDSSGNVVFRLGPAVDQPGGAAGTVFSGLAVGYAWISSGGFTVSNPNANQHYAGMAPGAIQLQYPLAGGGTAYARIEMTGDGLKIYSQSWPTENQVSSGCVYKDTNGYLRVKS